MKSETGPEQVRPARVLSPSSPLDRPLQSRSPRLDASSSDGPPAPRVYSSPGGLRRAPRFARSVEEVSRFFRRRKRSSSTEHASMGSRDQRTRTGAMIPRMGCASHVEADWRLRFGVSCARDSISRCLAGVAVACLCVCYGLRVDGTGRGTRTWHASGARNRHGGSTRGRVHTNQASGPSTHGSVKAPASPCSGSSAP